MNAQGFASGRLQGALRPLSTTITVHQWTEAQVDMQGAILSRNGETLRDSEHCGIGFLCLLVSFICGK